MSKKQLEFEREIENLDCMKRIMKKVFLPTAIATLFLSCGDIDTVKIDGNKKVVPSQKGSAYQAVNKNTKYVGTSKGVLDGKIILDSKVPFSTVMEYDSLKTLLTTIVSSDKMKITTHFNAEGKEQKFTNHDSGILKVLQEHKYNKRGDLLEELRIDINESQSDTILYKYNYKYKSSSKDYTMTRTNNGDPVTNYTVKHSGSKIFKTEEAFPNDRFYLKRLFETTLDDNGEPLEIKQTSIYKDASETKYDTTISRTVYEYNLAGKVISELNYNHGLKPSKILSKYKDDLISEKQIGSQVIRFNHLELDNQ